MEQISTSTAPFDPADNSAISKLPRIWIGYLIAVLLATGQFLNGFFTGSLSENTANTILRPFVSGFWLAGWIYWLICVYKFNDLMAEIPGYNHPITPWRAVGMHFIPLYNLYWAYKWPSEIATFVNWRTQSQAMKKWVPGLIVLAAMLAFRSVDSFIGLLLLFTSGIYISHHLRRAFAVPPVPSSAMMPSPTRGPLGL